MQKILWIDVNQTTSQSNYYGIDSARYDNSPLIWNTQIWTQETEKYVGENGLGDIDRLVYRNAWVGSGNPRTPYEKPLPAWWMVITKPARLTAKT